MTQNSIKGNFPSIKGNFEKMTIYKFLKLCHTKQHHKQSRNDR